MYFSYREKRILQYLLDYQQGVTPDELQHALQVSKRTVYREIASIEKSLVALQIQIVKPRGGGYQLVGESANLALLRKKLQEQKEKAFSNVERQSAVTAYLLVNEETTMESLAIDFDVSVATIQTDLQAVEASLPDYDLVLERMKGRGIRITGAESAQRQILSGLIYNGVNEYEFFQTLALLAEGTERQATTSFFLRLLQPEYLHWAAEAITNYPNQVFAAVTDNQVQQLVTGLAISLDRIAKGYLIRGGEENDALPVQEIHQIAQKLLEDFQQTFHLLVTQGEKRFLVQQLAGINYKTPQSIFLENFDAELSYRVKELIQYVSAHYLNDFRGDDQLFYALLAHMTAALKRSKSLNQANHHAWFDKIRQQYGTLYTQIEAGVQRYFAEAKFAGDELAYLVIHFATSLERHPQARSLKTLVLCSSGLGTSKILESRIRKYLPKIEEIQVAKISQMNYLDFHQYDLILSTIFLPSFPFPYKLISPLLLAEEIEEIGTELAAKLKGKAPSAETVATSEVNTTFAIEPKSAQEFDAVYDTMRVANQLLQHFRVQSLTATMTLAETLQQVTAELDEIVVRDPVVVANALIERYEVAPIGVPGTNFALFHTSNAAVIEPYFAIYDSQIPFAIQGMDRQPMKLTRLLVMLAPDPLPKNQQQLLGKISSSIIENDLNVEIYNHGNQAIIYQLLSKLFVKEIRAVE